MMVLLLGMRGVGKTTVGAALAERLRLPFADLDADVLARFPEASVRDVWALRGEAAWREAEVAALRERLEAPDGVIALGGGAPITPAVAEMMNERQEQLVATAVYLQCDGERLTERLAAQPGDRASLTGADLAAEVRDVLRDRHPVYLRLADFVVDVTDQSVENIVERIVALVRPGRRP
ncbi:MAG: AAA family ATPase [Phycisphaerales bacterium]|nr:AAA family ATPase [Phycisphaerales bacterium]